MRPGPGRTDLAEDSVVQNNHRIVKRPTHAIESVENALRILVLLQERDSLRIVDAAGDL